MTPYQFAEANGSFDKFSGFPLSSSREETAMRAMYQPLKTAKNKFQFAISAMRYPMPDARFSEHDRGVFQVLFDLLP